MNSYRLRVHKLFLAFVGLVQCTVCSSALADGDYDDSRAAIVSIIEQVYRTEVSSFGEMMRRHVKPGATVFQRFGFLDKIPRSEAAFTALCRLIDVSNEDKVAIRSPKMIEVQFINDGAAVATYYLEVSFGRKGEALRDRLARITTVFAREDSDDSQSNWKVVHHHVSDLESKPDELQVPPGYAQGKN